MNNETFNKIREFTIEQAAIREELIREDASLDNDLGITGDDAVEFIIAFGKTFDVDVSKFMAADYFNPEGDIILPTIIRFFTGKRKPKHKNLLLKHLAKAVIAGKLDEEVINS